MQNIFSHRAFSFIFICSACWAQTSPPVPASYQDLYDQLNGQISSFSQTIHASWDGTPYPVLDSAHLLAADSESASSLLTPNYYMNVVAPELNELQAVGVQSVTTHINFPILYPPYYSNPQDYQSYVTFYQQLAQDVHSRGMQLIIESATNTDLAGTNGGEYDSYYASLAWNDYMTGRAQNALNIAQLIQPDYLSVITEPDSEASDTGQTNAGTISGSTQELGVILSTLQAAGVTTPIGAGAGTWIKNFTQWIQAFTPYAVQYIDIHIYPPNQNYLPNALSAADIAHAAGKPIAMTEAWCEKVRDSEVGSTTLNFNDIEARYVYSFWAPIDTSFLQAIVDMSQYKQFLFIAPSWSRYFFAYLDYNQYPSISDDTTMENTAAQAAKAANTIGAFTSTGLAWESMIIPAPDTIAPALPAAPVVTTLGLNVVGMTWTASTDNIGVAGYNLYRNGAFFAVTSNLGYTDQTVSSGTAYSYAISAFDAAGNVSPLSAALNVTTLSPPDTQAPTTPGGLSGTGISDKQIFISWNPSTDDTGVSGYRIYRGSTAAALTLITSTSATSFTDNSSAIRPSTTYFYSVAAYDARNNSSAQTPAIAVAALADTTPPTVPGQFVAVPVSTTQINLSWAPSTDDIGVAGYKIYRGTTPNSLGLIGSTPSTAFNDTGRVSTQTYYYAVAAYDAAMNYSAQTAPLAAKPIADVTLPTTPLGLTGVALSSSQIQLSWSPSTDDAGIGGYSVYRGTSAQSLKQIANSAGTVYIDSNSILAGKTYYYAVAAYDRSNNYSPQSNVVAVTALSK